MKDRYCYRALYKNVSQAFLTIKLGGKKLSAVKLFARPLKKFWVRIDQDFDKRTF